MGMMEKEKQINGRDTLGVCINVCKMMSFHIKEESRERYCP